jgi:hypothetical protein
MFSEAEMRELNQRAYDNLQTLTDSLWVRGGRPSGAVLALNPDAPRMAFFKLMPFGGIGAWGDLDVPGAEGPELLSLVTYFIGGDRERAARWIADVLRNAPPTVEFPVRPAVGFRSAMNSRLTSGRVPRDAA